MELNVFLGYLERGNAYSLMFKNDKFAQKNDNSKNKNHHFICPLFQIIQMNFQILLTPLQHLNLFELVILN
jgi:hypothetical protein